jgi:hypothetical protein
MGLNKELFEDFQNEIKNKDSEEEEIEYYINNYVEL